MASHRFESKVLKSNPLSDPCVRDIIVYVPPGYSRTDSKGYTAIIYLAAFGSFGKAVLNLDPFSETIEARMNRLIWEKKCSPMILVLVDCFTKFGGSQYINPLGCTKITSLMKSLGSLTISTIYQIMQ